MTAVFRAMFLREIREMVRYSQGNNGRADLQKSRILKDVLEMTDLLLSTWLNPFSDESQPLASISISAVPSTDNALDFAKAYLSGEVAYQGLKSECPLRLSHIENMWHTMKNQNFSHSSQSIETWWVYLS